MSLKHFNLILFALLLTLIAPARAQDTTSNIEVSYKFIHQAGDIVVKDISGNHRNLVAVKLGAAQPFDSNLQWDTTTINGALQYMVYFPAGRDDNIELSNSPGNTWKGIAGSQARTFCAWVKIDAGADDFTGRTLFAYGDDSQTGGRFEIDLKGHGIEFENAANNAGNSWNNRSVFTLNNTDQPQGHWMHIALVFDGTGNRKTGISLYINGKKVTFSPLTDSSDLSINTALQYAPEIGTYMVGMAIADMRVFSRALTADDIHLICPDPSDPVNLFSIAHLNDLIQTAATNGDHEVIIPKGTYTGEVTGGGFIYLNGANDLIINADNVTMLCGKKTRALELANCKNVTVKGLTIDYNPLTFTQGDIIATGTGYVDIKIHRGYDVKPYSRIDIIDPATRYRKNGSIYLWGSTAAITGDSVVRISQPDLPGVAIVGDMASLSTGNDDGIPHALCISDCRGGIQLQNVTVYAAPGFGIFESGGEGGTHLDSCRVMPGPLPAGATQARLLSSSWDAIQHKLTRVGPTIENCKVIDAGDDSWSVTWDGEYTIGTVSGNTITVTPDNLAVGDSLRTSLTSDVVFITAKAGTTLTLNKPSPWVAGTRMYSPSRRCENFVLRNSYFNSTGRVLVKAGNGLIENNTFLNTHCGISVNTEIAPGAAAISNLIIRNNSITGTGHYMAASYSNQAGAITITDGSGQALSQSGVFNNILIANNTFDSVSGVNIVVSSASYVNIKENVFNNTGLSVPNNTGADYGINQNTVVYLKNLNNITLDSNEVINQGLSLLLDSANVKGFIKLRRGIFIRSANPLPLSVYLTGPANNASYTVGSPVTINSMVLGNTDITKVEFYQGLTKLGESTALPYSFTWNHPATGNYKITAKAIAGDNSTATSDEVNITVAENGQTNVLPINPRNLFTPNGDGHNDYWEIENIDQHPGMKVTIYNRTGVQVYSAKPFARWDGIDNGTPAATGVYFYSVTENNKVVKSGSITLIR